MKQTLSMIYNKRKLIRVNRIMKNILKLATRRFQKIKVLASLAFYTINKK